MDKEITILVLILLFICIFFAYILGFVDGYKRGQVDALQGKFNYKLEQKIINTPVKLP